MPRSTRVTGNDPLDGVDPGGTRPARPRKAGARGPAPVQTVQSGDRYTLREGSGAVDDAPQ
jgi:hypothetical protein